MPLFEVFIPTNDTDGFNITAKIKADSWILALRNGLSKLGDTTDVRNIMCDITESGIDVTEPNSGRVFRIRELSEQPVVQQAPQPVVQQAPQPIMQAPPPAVKIASSATAVMAAEKENVTIQAAPLLAGVRPRDAGCR